MPGWYIHINVARKGIDALSSNPTAAPIFAANGPDAASLTQIAHDEPAYAALGSIGPDIFFFFLILSRRSEACSEACWGDPRYLHMVGRQLSGAL